MRDALHLNLEVAYPWWRQLEHYLPGVYEQVEQRFKASRGAGWWSVPSWWTFQRHLNRNYELLPACAECFISPP